MGAGLMFSGFQWTAVSGPGMCTPVENVRTPPKSRKLTAEFRMGSGHGGRRGPLVVGQ